MRFTLIKNFIYAFGAQFVSFLSTLVVTFLVSGKIGPIEFAYWQLFLTYVSYVSITRIGINDGLYLRLGGRNYSELDFKLLSKEKNIFDVYQLVISCIFLLYVLSLNIDINRIIVLLSCACCIYIVNSNGFLIYILQAVNLTNVYSVSLIIQNSTWFIACILIYVLKLNSFKILVIFYVLGHILAGIYLRYHSKEIIKYYDFSLRLAFKDLLKNIHSGIILMISTYAGSFVISSCRLIIDGAWGVEVFGSFSFSLTLSSVLLTFISQVSIIVFPALRRIDKSKIQIIYEIMHNILHLILPLVMFGYLPIVLIVSFILPEYIASLSYLPFFLPICIFDGKMQLLCSSFLKTLRKEKALLYVNLLTLLSSILMGLIGAYIFKNVRFVALSVLLVIMLRSIISEVYLSKLMVADIKSDLFQETALTFLFIILSSFCSPIGMFFIFLVLYLLYLILNSKKVCKIIEFIRNGYVC